MCIYAKMQCHLYSVENSLKCAFQTKPKKLSQLYKAQSSNVLLFSENSSWVYRQVKLEQNENKGGFLLCNRLTAAKAVQK